MTTLEKIQTEVDPSVTEETPVDALGLDSLELVQLLLDLNIPLEKAVDLNTVADLIRESH
ncbi:hypothetical protein ACFPT7_02185 [Acidicapsa dinghuensis]|uniref:Acyl carrier protein n=1 Tax=Acidicapsa dinghuensis TaxID=2218256 RepID=A0ABW1E9T8_9BACT|nr:hypothetical protein [Acidicapsa dinghuensis]